MLWPIAREKRQNPRSSETAVLAAVSRRYRAVGYAAIEYRDEDAESLRLWIRMPSFRFRRAIFISKRRERETHEGSLVQVSAKRPRETYDTLLQTELPLVPLPSTSTRSEYREIYEKP